MSTLLTVDEAKIKVKEAEEKLLALLEEQENNLSHKLELEGIYYHNPNLPIYKYVTYERAIQILSNNSIFYSSCKNFNDPFELNDALLNVDYDEALEQAKTTALSKANFVSQKVLDLFLEELDRLKEKHLEDLKQFFEASRNKLGIFCASKTYLNTLMWSHYGNSHKGICLGFHIKPIKDETTYTYLSVAYKEHLKPVPFSFVNPEQHYFSLIYWMNVKSKVWEYEQEIRVINFKQNGVVALDNMEIKEIFYGVGLSESETKDIDDIINAKAYNILKKGKMKISKDTFNLELIAM